MTFDPTQVDNPWSAITFIAVLAYLVYNSWSSKRHSKNAAGDAKRAADTIEHEANPNSGQSMKDSLNRLEAGVGEIKGDVSEIKDTQYDHGARLAALERTQMRPHWFSRR